MRLKGRPTKEQQADSTEFSQQLLTEYNTTKITYALLAQKYRISPYAVFRRLQKARYMKMVAQ